MKQSLLNFSVIVDAGEERLANELRKYLNVVQKRLVVGDVVCSDRLVVERKSSFDFISSIFDGRLFKQAEKMRLFYEKPVFIIEGSIWDGERDKSKAGAIGSLITQFNANIIFSEGIEETGLIIYELSKIEKGLGKKISFVNKKIYEDPVMNVLTSLPGIGEKRAKLLREKFRTLKDLFSADKKELCLILPKKEAEKLYRLFNSPI